MVPCRVFERIFVKSILPNLIAHKIQLLVTKIHLYYTQITQFSLKLCHMCFKSKKKKKQQQCNETAFVYFPDFKFTNFICNCVMQRGEKVENEVSNTTYFLLFLCVLQVRKRCGSSGSYSHISNNFLIHPLHTQRTTTVCHDPCFVGVQPL